MMGGHMERNPSVRFCSSTFDKEEKEEEEAARSCALLADYIGSNC